MKHLNLVSRIFLLSLIILSSSFYSNSQTVTVVNNTSAVMHVWFTVVAPPSCQDASGSIGVETHTMLAPGGQSTFAIHPSEVIDQVISEPDPWCNDDGSGILKRNAYLTGNCGAGSDRCGQSVTQYTNPWTGEVCNGNPLNWCNVVVGNTIYIQ